MTIEELKMLNWVQDKNIKTTDSGTYTAIDISLIAKKVICKSDNNCNLIYVGFEEFKKCFNKDKVLF